MATINVVLPDPLKDWLESRARDARSDSVGDYVRDLIQREREDADAQTDLERLIDEGFESGVSTRSIDEIFAAARDQAVLRREA